MDYDDLTNLEEYLHGTNPLNLDTDSDGMPDGWEVKYNLDPLTNDASGDADNDGLLNIEEYRKGTNPNNKDTDDDGWLDSVDLDPIKSLCPLSLCASSPSDIIHRRN